MTMNSCVPRVPMVDHLHPESLQGPLPVDLPRVKLVISGRKQSQTELLGSVPVTKGGQFLEGPSRWSLEDEARQKTEPRKRRMTSRRKDGVVKKKNLGVRGPSREDIQDVKDFHFQQSPEEVHNETFQSDLFGLEFAIGIGGEKETDFYHVRWTDYSDENGSLSPKASKSIRSEDESRRPASYDSDSVYLPEKCPEMNLNSCRISTNNDDEASLDCDDEDGLMLENDDYTIRKENHSISGAEARRIFSCLYCEFIGNKSSWLSHLARSHADKSLLFCTFKNCQMPFESKTKLASHIAEAHESVFVCSFNFCARTFHSRSSLVEHEKDHKSEDGIRNHGKASSEESEESFMCTYCGKKYRTRNGFKAHEATVHTRKLKHKCTHEGCNAAFFYFSELAVHTRKHTGELPFTCSFCGARYISHATLAQHERAAHLQTEDTECHICQKKLRKRNLPGHLKTHEGYDGIPCSVCGKEFPTIGGKNRHEKIHFEVKQHSCGFCGKSFVQRANMVAHERIHTGERPYKCKHCQEGFPQQTRRNQHEQTCKHKDAAADQELFH